MLVQYRLFIKSRNRLFFRSQVLGFDSFSINQESMRTLDPDCYTQLGRWIKKPLFLSELIFDLFQLNELKYHYFT